MREVQQPAMPQPNRLERFIGWLSPGRAAKREVQRQMLNRARTTDFAVYRGAETSRLTGNNWMASKLSHDSALEADLESLRDRSSELYRDEGIVAAYVDSRVSKIVGVGLRPQALIQPKEGLISEEQADTWNAELENVFNRLSPYIDFNGVLSQPEIERQIERNWAIDGDVFIRFRARASVDKPIPLAIEVIPANRVATPIGMEGDESVRLGIRYDANGQRLGYYVLKDPPNDTLRFSQDYEYVEAFDEETGLPLMVHLFDQLFPGQSRGVPAVTPVLADIKDIKDLREAIVIREQGRACIMGIVTDSPDPLAQATMNATGVTPNGAREENLSPGAIKYLPGSQKFDLVDPGTGGSEYANFMDRTMLNIAAALNWPYSWLTKDYRQSTYSSERMALIDGGSVVECRQQLHSLRFLRFLWQYLCDQAMLTGELSVDPDFYWMNRPLMQNHSWIPPGVPWIDPKKDIEAAVLAINNNLDSKYNIIARGGRDPEQIQAQRSREKEWDKQWNIQPAEQQMAEAQATATASPEPEPVEAAV